MNASPYLWADIKARLHGANDVCKRVVADPKCKLSDNSKRCYVERAASLQRRFPDVRINEFTAEHLDTFFTFDASGARRKVGTPGWRESTVNCYINALVYLFGWAVEHGLAEVDPCERIRQDWMQKVVHHREGIWLDADTIDLLCDLDVGEDFFELRDRMICTVFVGTGLRCFEFEALTWGQLRDIAAPKGRIRVHGKGNKYRQVTPLAMCRAALIEWRKVVTNLRGCEPADTDPVIPGVTMRSRGPGTAYRTPNWTRGLGRTGMSTAVAAAGARVGVPRLRPHDLRRTHAGFMEDKDISLRAIKDQLGHASLVTTERYLAYNPSRVQDEFTKAGI